MNRFTIAKGLTGLAVFGAALAAGAAAQAQPGYGAGNGYYYDPCRREQSSRSIVGGLIGAGIGAALGNNIAAGGHRGDGSVLGGVVGAMAGASIGKANAACQPTTPAYTGNDYYNQGHGYGRSGYYDAPQAYYPPPPPPPPPSYGRRGYGGYGAGYGGGYGGYGYGGPVHSSTTYSYTYIR